MQPERTALSWRRTIMSAIAADILIWRGWFQALTGAGGGAADNTAQVVGMGVCASVAALTTIILVLCAVARIKVLHSGTAALESEARIAAPALTLRTASAAIVALAAATVSAIALGM
nr:DUF202 domain-containing protein [Arthrobacter stackebrandtii]